MSKVLFIIPTLNSGGIETYLLRFLKFNKTEINCVILVRSLNSGNLESAYLSLGFKVVKMPLGYFNVLKAFRFYEFIRREGFDAICDFNANFSGISIWISWLSGIKKRIVFYRQASNHFRENLIKRIYNECLNRVVYSFSTDILSNSRTALNFFFKNKWISDNRFKVIYNGVDVVALEKTDHAILRNQLELPKNAFIVGHCGRLDKAKNHQVILKVMQQLIALDSTFYLVLVGEGTEQLEEECKLLKIRDHVFLYGFRNDVHSIMKVFDCFLFPSITEGQPNALIEAWLLGIPTVVSSISSIAEILPEELGTFSKEPNDVMGFCDLIIRMRGNKVSYDLHAVREYAANQFNYKKRFDEFISVLLPSE